MNKNYSAYSTHFAFHMSDLENKIRSFKFDKSQKSLGICSYKYIRLLYIGYILMLFLRAHLIAHFFIDPNCRFLTLLRIW